MTSTSTTPDASPEDTAVTITDSTINSIIDAPTDVDLDAPDTDPVPLNEDDLACGQCGARVEGPVDISLVTWAEADAVQRSPELGISTAPISLNPEPLTTCTTCASRADLARLLAETLLPRGVAVGGLTVRGSQAAELVEAALRTLAVLGKPMPNPDALTTRVLRMMVSRLAEPAGRLSWASMFSPVRWSDARPGTAAARPWSHVTDETRDSLRRAYIAFAADRMSLDQPDVALPPPPFAPTGTALGVPSACLLCGVGEIVRPAAAVARSGGRMEAANEAWSYRSSVPPSSLGGMRSPRHLAGFTCDHCTDAVERAGAVGPTAMERSLLASLGLTSRWHEGADALGGLIAFGAIYSNATRKGLPLPSPNVEPWAHVGDLDQLRAKIAPKLGG